ncbi:MAG: VOC family protein [Okeania sp. SIO2C2]|uniref:VOC family protein n=1 Tax=Okeania sp. SIO2C2 TaxID=2607787 RepID=UPI0013BCAFA6|nr:VOC family protein [Okeania sp. SIO2C2]NEP90905.1 VOC family protein [Okeania sp. SIO2C2]
MKTAIKFFQTLAIALAISVAFLSIPGTTSPAAAYDCQYLPSGPRTSGVVTRVNVVDFEASKEFYGDLLGMTCIFNFDGPYWTEFYNSVDPQAQASIGLSNQFGSPEERYVTSVIVPDLASACENLNAFGFPITSSEYAGQGVCLASFNDLSGNELAYRQENWGILDANYPEEESDIAAECRAIIEEFCQ